MAENRLIAIARRWLDIIADGDYEAWTDITTPDLRIYTPFAPPDLPTIWEGRDMALAMARKYGEFIRSLTFHDVDLHTTDSPGLVMGTARSEGQGPAGVAYNNAYAVIVRISDERVSEYHEYFNPLRVLPLLGIDIPRLQV